MTKNHQKFDQILIIFDQHYLDLESFLADDFPKNDRRRKIDHSRTL